MPSPRLRPALSRLLVAGLLLGLPLSAQAARAPGTFTAELVAPVGEARRELLGEQTWRCAETRCSARFDGAHPLRTCARVVQVFGPVAGFASPAGPLSAQQIARCNGAK